MFRITLASFLFILFILLTPSSTFAHHQREVLGEETDASQMQFPPVTSGAGFFLPDNPLYFLDTLFQNVRLAVAFTPEKRAKLHAEIAGERLSELRLMVARNNDGGIERALSELENEMESSAEVISDAGARGQAISGTAQEINETIKSQRVILGVLESQATGTLKLRLKTARQALKEAKVEVEDELPEELLAQEIVLNVEEEVTEDMHEADSSLSGLEHSIDVLTKLASQAAEREQTKRYEALQKAIENKEEALRRKTQGEVDLARRRQEKLQKVTDETLKQTRETVKNAREAALRFEEMKRLKNEQSEEETSKIPSPTSSAASNSAE